MASGQQLSEEYIRRFTAWVLDRTLLYTAITSAQVQVIRVGNVEAARCATMAPSKARERNLALDC